MARSERRERERQAMRLSILKAAREIARSSGWQAVTLRKVADRIGYGAATLYEYFPAKEAILEAVAQEGFEALLARLRAAPTAGQPRERLRQVADAYWEFAMENPELYQAMFGLDGVPFPPVRRSEGLLFLLLALREELAPLRREPVESSGLQGDAEILLATLHGHLSLALAGRLGGGAERGEWLMKRAVRTLLEQWGE
ncbi:MAG: TetR/AcrR family transcriptional regulator [Bacillota bacterium]